MADRARVDGIVQQGEWLFTPADDGLAKEFDSRCTNQHGGAEIDGDFDAVLLNRSSRFMAISSGMRAIFCVRS
jgi:hypothetical protein